MLSINSLKHVLTLAGINNLTVKFDTSHREIHTRFAYLGHVYEKNIPFAEIEAVFTDSPTTPPAASLAASTPKRAANITPF